MIDNFEFISLICDFFFYSFDRSSKNSSRDEQIEGRKKNYIKLNKLIN